MTAALLQDQLREWLAPVKTAQTTLIISRRRRRRGLPMLSIPMPSWPLDRRVWYLCSVAKGARAGGDHRGFVESNLGNRELLLVATAARLPRDGRLLLMILAVGILGPYWQWQGSGRDVAITGEGSAGNQSVIPEFDPTAQEKKTPHHALPRLLARSRQGTSDCMH